MTNKRLLELAGLQPLSEAPHHNMVVMTTFDDGELTGVIAFPNEADAKAFAKRHAKEVGKWFHIDDVLTPEEFLQTFED